ncbi:plasmolipin [Colossoma macropomum]|uniref:plasmolipin n=1 Tax=Colossoma macropomum TaxID=42526 RepID=UPI0018647025|nr:plasmolipin [Colossoma macropomum]
MADFPGKVSTETSSPQSQTGSMQLMNISTDLNFIKTIPGILLFAEIVLGLLVWALISSAAYQAVPAYGWVMFVSVTLWILSIVLFIILFLNLKQKLVSVPWPLVLMVFYAVATVLYLTAFVANAASVSVYVICYHYNRMAAAAFFGIVVTLTYAASAFFAYLDWRGDGGNAATSTVPV